MLWPLWVALSAVYPNKVLCFDEEQRILTVDDLVVMGKDELLAGANTTLENLALLSVPLKEQWLRCFPDLSLGWNPVWNIYLGKYCMSCPGIAPRIALLLVMGHAGLYNPLDAVLAQEKPHIPVSAVPGCSGVIFFSTEVIEFMLGEIMDLFYSWSMRNMFSCKF